MNDLIAQQLDKILLLNKEKQEALKTIKTAQSKRIGRYQVSISDKEKTIMSKKANKFFDAKINSIYASINKQLEDAGQPMLQNPFMKGEN
jgi:uncharacterized membrane protein YheB (UPF0754 family)